MKEKVFISSVQKEFANERLALTAYIREDSSYPHNPLLANCMFLTGAIERFGTGIPDMFTLTAERGLKDPEFEENKSFVVTLWRPSAMATAHDTAHDTGQVTGQVQFFNNLSEPERLVLVLNGEMTRDALMNKLDLKHRDNFMEKYLNPAIANIWVERTIPDKPTSSKQKYRLSKEGAAYKMKLQHESK